MDGSNTVRPHPARRPRKAAGKPQAGKAVGTSDGPGEPPDEGWGEKVRAHRRRQASVAAILDQTFGRFADSGPELWERRAYLMLVGLVYERLAVNEDEISTDELVTLAKVLAENRRAEARSRLDLPSDGPVEPTTPPIGELPDRFADVVRQVYGTKLDAAESDEETKKSDEATKRRRGRAAEGHRDVRYRSEPRLLRSGQASDGGIMIAD